MITLKTIAIAELKRCPIQLRPVCKETLEYVQLRDSIRDHGILQPLLVRPQGDHCETIDGNNRYEIALDLRMPSVPCIVREMSDKEVLLFQLVAHSSRIETTPVQYARRLWRIIEVEKALTLNELAMHIRRHPDWLRRILNLVKLSITAQNYLTESRFSVKIGIELAKLPYEKQDEILALLDTMPQAEFRNLVTKEARHHRQNKKDTRLEAKAESTYEYRSFKEVTSELDRPIVAASILTNENASSSLEGWTAALKWVLKTDAATVAHDLQRREKDQARRAALLERRTAEHLNRKRNSNG